MVLDILIIISIIYAFIGVLHALKHILEEIYSNNNSYGDSKLGSILMLCLIAFLLYPLIWGLRYIKIGGYEK